MASFCSFDSCAILENSIYYAGFLVPEAVAQICSVKKVFLGISQNSQENNCARASLFKKFLKKETLAQVFCSEFYKIFRSTFFYITPLVAAFVVHLGHFHRCNLVELVWRTQVQSVSRIFQISTWKYLLCVQQKVFRVFIFPYFILSWCIFVQSMELSNVWLK